MKNRMRESLSDGVFNIIVTVILVFVLLSVMYPLFFVLIASISDPMMVMQGKTWLLPVNINFDAYRDVLSDQFILSGYKNTLMYTLAGTALNLVMTVMCAYPLSRKDFAGRNVLTFILSFTMFFSGGLIPTYLIIKDLHLVDNFWVMILPQAVSVYNMIIMRTYFQHSIPWELHESAWLDGCSNIKMLTGIVLPLSTPIIAVVALFYGVTQWNNYFQALIYLSTRSKFPLQLILREILVQTDVNSMLQSSDVDSLYNQIMRGEGIKYAVIVVASAPVLMVYPFIQRYFVKGIMMGAIKG